MKIFNKSEAKIVLIIFVMAVIFRILVPLVNETIYSKKSFIAFGKNFNQKYLNDDIWYSFSAKSIMEGHGLAINPKEIRDNLGYEINKTEKYPDMFINNGKDYYRHKAIPPIYPIFIAILYKLFGINTLAFYVPQILIGAFSCVLLFYIAKEVFNQKVAAGAGLFMAFYPELANWTYHIRVETLFIFLILLIFYLLSAGKSTEGSWSAILFGIILALTCLTRLTFLFFVPILFVWKYITAEGDKNNAIKWIAVVSLTFGACLLPWAIRNYIVFHNFTVLTEEAGTIFMDYPKSKEYSSVMSFSLAKESYAKIYLSYILHNPIEFVASSLNRILLFLGPITIHMDHLAKIFKGTVWLLVFPVAYGGIIYSIIKGNKKTYLLILFIVYYILFHGLTFVDDGLVYRYPILPFICIFSAYGYFAGMGRINDQRCDK